MTLLLCPLCLGARFTSEEALLYELISLASRKIRCPICTDILSGFDKFTVHLCSHILKCDSNPVSLKIDASMVEINKQLENINLQRECETPLNLCSSGPSVDTSRVKNDVINNVATTPSEDKNLNQVPFEANYLVQYSAESEVGCDRLLKDGTGITYEFGRFSVNNVWPVQNTDDLRCVDPQSSSPDYNNLVEQLRNDLSEIDERTDDTSRVESDVINNVAATLSEDKNLNQVPFEANYLVQYWAESEVGYDTLAKDGTGITHELGRLSVNNVWPVQDTDDLRCVETQSSLSYNNLVEQLRNDFSEINKTVDDRGSNILHVDFFSEDVPVTVISNPSTDDKVIEKESGSECNSCSILFTDSVLLKLHNELVHGENSENMASFKYRCDRCEKKFKIRGSLLIHQQAAHRSSCDESTTSLHGPTSNLDNEEGGKQHVCKICFKFFKKEYYLQQHLKVHEEKQWNCDECGKSFTTKYFLKKHKRLHTGEMPYSCSICGKNFTFQQSYHRHMMYHNAEKPYSCEECGRSFKELSTLYNHQRIHTGEKPYSCDVCDSNYMPNICVLCNKFLTLHFNVCINIVLTDVMEKIFVKEWLA